MLPYDRRDAQVTPIYNYFIIALIIIIFLISLFYSPYHNCDEKYERDDKDEDYKSEKYNITKYS